MSVTIVEYMASGGMVAADGDALEVARSLLARESVNVSTGLIIDWLRWMICTGEINTDQVQFRFEGKVLPHTDQGRITKWPEGFNDQVVNILSQLL
jgi:hypothetical protein